MAKHATDTPCSANVRAIRRPIPRLAPVTTASFFPAKPLGCYGDEDCPDDLSCNAIEVCDPPPGCTDPALPCPAVCYGTCVATTDPASCYGEVFCDSIPPACPADETPAIAADCRVLADS